MDLRRPACLPLHAQVFCPAQQTQPLYVSLSEFRKRTRVRSPASAGAQWCLMIDRQEELCSRLLEESTPPPSASSGLAGTM